jgi:hypothetical protein
VRSGNDSFVLSYLARMWAIQRLNEFEDLVLTRSTGHPIKIFEAACSLFGDMAGVEFAKKVPGRAMRGRPCSNYYIESYIINALGCWQNG